MAYGLIAYSDSLQGKTTRDLSIKITQVENGYIFELNGEIENTRKPVKGDYFERWINVKKSFVYEKLENGVIEVQGFFEILKKELKEKVQTKNKNERKENI